METHQIHVPSNIHESNIWWSIIEVVGSMHMLLAHLISSYINRAISEGGEASITSEVREFLY